MKFLYLLIAMFTFSFPLLGCGGAPEVSSEGDTEMEQLSQDEEYMKQMMGESK